MIYTSYFAKYRGDNGVSITRFTPKWWKGPECKELAPSIELLNWWKSLPEECRHSTGYIVEYTERFIEETLKKIDVGKLAKELDGKVLLCYENLDKDFCHREVVAQWFNALGYECEEIEYGE